MSSKMKGLMDVSEELKAKLYDLERWEGMTQAQMLKITKNVIMIIHDHDFFSTNKVAKPYNAAEYL